MARFIRTRAAKLGVAIFVSLGLVAAVVAPLIKPDVLPPSNYHPGAIYYRIKGIKVHPLVPVDPEKPYQLDVRSRDWPVRGAEGLSYRDFLQGIVDGFKEKHPNVKVKLSLTPFEEEERDIWSRGPDNLPDIYLGTPDGLPAFALEAAVPLEVFLPQEERVRYEPCALRALSRDGKLLAWPHSMGIYGWAANLALLRKAGIDHMSIIANGWTWDEFLAVAQKIAGTSPAPREEFRVFGLALDDSNSLFLEHLILNSGAKSIFGPNGGPGWTPSQLKAALAFLGEIKSRGLFPNTGVNMSASFLYLFWEGRVGFIAPAGPPFLRHLWDQSRNPKRFPGADQDVLPILLPVPAKQKDLRTTPTEPFAAWVFLKHEGKSRLQPRESQTAKIAVELARELSRRRGAWLASKLKTLPAYRPDRAWQEGTLAFWESGPAFIEESLKYVRQELPEGDIGILRRDVLDPLIRDLH